MKNLYLINTKAPSRLDEFGGQWFLSDTPEAGLRNYNIYITSDETIKEGHWVITPTNDIIQWAKVFQPNGEKIILTTDPKLIDDGIQPIGDDFLEWFVNNPKCEFVEVSYIEDVDFFNYDYSYYQITIPPFTESLTITTPVENNKQELNLFEYMDWYAIDVMKGCNLNAKEWFNKYVINNTTNER